MLIYAQVYKKNTTIYFTYFRIYITLHRLRRSVVSARVTFNFVIFNRIITITDGKKLRNSRFG